jgi:hypothetical protein
VGNLLGASLNSAKCTPPPDSPVACEYAGRQHSLDEVGRAVGAIVGASLLMSAAVHYANHQRGSYRRSAVAALMIGALGGTLATALYYSDLEDAAAVAALSTLAFQVQVVIAGQPSAR